MFLSWPKAFSLCLNLAGTVLHPDMSVVRGNGKFPPLTIKVAVAAERDHDLNRLPLSHHKCTTHDNVPETERFSYTTNLMHSFADHSCVSSKWKYNIPFIL
jgi:hypothetical protein